MSEFFLRTESIKLDEIQSYAVINHNDQTIINALKSPDPCLLEGSRGTGKSFLMRMAELELESHASSNLSIYVSFNISSLINTSDPLQFYHWMLAKTLRAMLNKLRKRGLSVSEFTSSLLSNDSTKRIDELSKGLKEIIKNYEKSYKGQSRVEIENLPDIEEVKEAIENICRENNLERVFFFFDEAAHVFRPEQQRQFFSLFKDLRSAYVTCNAAIYPGVTYFGDSFEPTHDSTYKKLDRNIRDTGYVEYFKNIVFNQATDKLQKEIDHNYGLFITLALCCGGNPRILLKTIQDLEKFNTSSVNQIIKGFYRGQIWTEHTDLGNKYKGHKVLIDWGRDFLENYAIPAIQAYNETRKHNNVKETSIYFWIHKDSPETVKEALRLLNYTGIIRKERSNIRATRSQLGHRYEVKYGCLVSLEGNPANESKDFYDSLSLKKFAEFGKNHQSYHSINELTKMIEDEATFKISLQNMLKKPIDVLNLLSEWKKGKLKDAGISTLEQLHENSEEDLIEKIYGVGPARARVMKNAANAELLEYLSG